MRAVAESGSLAPIPLPSLVPMSLATSSSRFEQALKSLNPFEKGRRLSERFEALGSRDQRFVLRQIGFENVAAAEPSAERQRLEKQRRARNGAAVAVFAAASAGLAASAPSHGSLLLWLAFVALFLAFAGHEGLRRAQSSRVERETNWRFHVFGDDESARANADAALAALLAWERAHPERAYALDREDPRLIPPSRLVRS